MTTFRILVLVSTTFFCADSFAHKDTQSYADRIETFATQKTFSEVLFEINFAITQHNFRITSRANLSKGVRERGHNDFPSFEIIHLCNLELAREALEIDPGYVVYMPCKITIHEQGDTTVISIVKLPENHRDQRLEVFAKNVNQQLVNIVRFAASFEGIEQ